MRVLFLYLKAFSFTGGIEKFNLCFLKTLHELTIEGTCDAYAISAYDKKANERYFHNGRFRGWDGSRVFFGLHSILKSLQSSTVILGHINLSVVGWIIKKLRPTTRVIVVVHGIEVWRQLHGMRLKMLLECDLILSVSEFTKTRLIEANRSLDNSKIKVFPNTIDPYFVFPNLLKKPQYLLDRYGIRPGENILLTITRLSSSEQYKGYDRVLEALTDRQLRNLPIKYLLCGKADQVEQQRIQNKIKQSGLERTVKLVGFVPEKELTDHYLLADVFVMPSKKEGFGIVFIEAIACGVNVIAGSRDGSREALLDGKLGKLIDPDSMDDLKRALIDSLGNHQTDTFTLKTIMLDNFGFPKYKERLKMCLTAI